MNSVEIRAHAREILDSGSEMQGEAGERLKLLLLTEIAAAAVSIANALSHNLNVNTYQPDPYPDLPDPLP